MFIDEEVPTERESSGAAKMASFAFLGSINIASLRD
jgi:hypothetical protein